MMEVHLQAMRGKMGARTYYACLMPMSAVPQPIVVLASWSPKLPENNSAAKPKATNVINVCFGWPGREGLVNVAGT